MAKPAKILLVEDELLSAFHMTRQLKKLGFGVHPVLAFGEDAVSCTERDRPDLILMDISLAGEMSGLEAVRHIKERFDVPVIFVTGYSDPEIREQAAALEPVAFLVKPVDDKTLRKWVYSVLPVPEAEVD
jgi:CheY-like chemotaxis protein